MAEKESRDKQLREEKARKRNEQKELFRAEVDLVNRLKDEMEAERKIQEEKRRQEKIQFRTEFIYKHHENSMLSFIFQLAGVTWTTWPCCSGRT